MAVNKVVQSNGTTLIDITPTTAVESDVASGKIFFLADGTQATGTSSGTPSATAHTIYFEFSDGTDATIPVYYDDSLIGTMITAYTPSAYGGKTVTLAQLDGVTWYEQVNIPIGVQLVDYNAVLTGRSIENNGSIVNSDFWDCVTDYILIDSTMTFSFTSNQYANIGFYDANKNAIRTVEADDIKDRAEDYVAYGTLTPSKIPSNAVYVVLSGNSYDIENTLSLIRTA